MEVVPVIKEYYRKFIDNQSAIEKRVGETLSVSGLVDPLCIYQRVKGHRHSTDDALTAWYALEKCSDAKIALDLGTGIGSVGLAVLWGLGEKAHLTCIEAQDISYAILKANIECNDLNNRVTAIHGDLRELNLGNKFPLITGSPPYFPKDAGIIPEDSQKAHARFELRGDVSDYARVAEKHLEDGGVFVFCFPYQQKARCFSLVESTGFRIATVRDVIPRRSKAPLFSLYSARLNWTQKLVEEPAIIVADDNGRYTPEMLEIQRSRGFGPEGTNILG